MRNHSLFNTFKTMKDTKYIIDELLNCSAERMRKLSNHSILKEGRNALLFYEGMELYSYKSLGIVVS